VTRDDASVRVSSGSCSPRAVRQGRIGARASRPQGEPEARMPPHLLSRAGEGNRHDRLGCGGTLRKKSEVVVPSITGSVSAASVREALGAGAGGPRAGGWRFVGASVGRLQRCGLAMVEKGADWPGPAPDVVREHGSGPGGQGGR
jgi:hypothetical protein